MNRLFCFSLICLLLIIACSPANAGFECKDGICVSIEVEEPVQALQPITFTIIVKTEKDIPSLGISLSVDRSISIVNIGKSPENANLTYQDKFLLGWLIETKSGEAYVFSGEVVFDRPTISYGIFGYNLLAYASNQSTNQVNDSVKIYLDTNGNQIEDSQAKSLVETGFPVPSPPPDQTIVPETPFPTMIPFTSTPSSSPTIPGYPGAGDSSFDEGGEENGLLPAYP